VITFARHTLCIYKTKKFYCINFVFPSQESILQSNQDASESSECDTDNSTSSMPRMSRSQSERLLAISKDHVIQERDLREKYHEIVFSSLEKVMRLSQSNQMKMLRVLLDKETAEVMKKLQDRRRHEMKSLAKIHKDKDEIGRYDGIKKQKKLNYPV
jgi:phosphatidylinositol phospholipase C, beta